MHQGDVGEGWQRARLAVVALLVVAAGEAVAAAAAVLHVQVRGPALPAALLGQAGAVRAAGDTVFACGGAAVEGEAVAEALTGLDVVQDRAAAGPVQPELP